MKKIVCLFFLINLCHGQVNNEAFATKWINADDGLNQLSVRNCIEDKDGIIYIATELGLYKYDGAKVVIVKDATYPEISGKRIFSLTKDFNTGIIYFVTHPDLKTYCILNGKVQQVFNIYYKESFLFHYSLVNATSDNNKMIIKFLKKNYFINFKKEPFSDCILTADNYIYFKGNGYLGCIDKDCNETKLKDTKKGQYNFFQFQDNIILLDEKKAELIKETKLLPTKIHCDSIFGQYFTKKNEAAKKIVFLESDRKYFLIFSNNVYEILYENYRLYTKFLFKFPADNLRNIYYSKKNDLFFVGTGTMGMAILKPKSFNILATGNNYFDCNYAVVEKNNVWYSYNGWVYDRIRNNYKYNNFTKYSYNNRFLLTLTQVAANHPELPLFRAYW